MKILLICPYPFSSAPSQRFRFEQYLDYLETSGAEVTQIPFFDSQTYKNLYEDRSGIKIVAAIISSLYKRITTLRKAKRASHVFVHREAIPFGPPVFEWIIAKILRKKIIYDFDDAIWLRDPSESWLVYFLKCKWKVKYICKWSYKISAGNKYLADYARKYNSNVVVNPTTIDTQSHHNPETFEPIGNQNKPIVGWTGTHSTLVYLEEISEVLQEVCNSGMAEVLIICNRKPQFDWEGWRFVAWSKETEIEDLMKIDIGIMPLTDDQWSKGKCGFKILQYMALAKATIASPVGVNKEIIQDGVNGFLAKSVDEWKNFIIKLAKDEQLRKQFGQRGRQTVAEHYSVESNKETFLTLFD